MFSLWFAFSFGALTFVTGFEQTDHGEYGYFNTWRKTICENQEETILQDIEECYLLENKEITEIVDKCYEEVMPEAEGIFSAYASAACQNKDLFHKVDECLTEVTVETEMKKLKIKGEAMDCYVEKIQKHGLKELMFYFEDVSEEK